MKPAESRDVFPKVLTSTWLFIWTFFGVMRCPTSFHSAISLFKSREGWRPLLNAWADIARPFLSEAMLCVLSAVRRLAFLPPLWRAKAKKKASDRLEPCSLRSGQRCFSGLRPPKKGCWRQRKRPNLSSFLPSLTSGKPFFEKRTLGGEEKKVWKRKLFSFLSCHPKRGKSGVKRGSKISPKFALLHLLLSFLLFFHFPPSWHRFIMHFCFWREVKSPLFSPRITLHGYIFTPLPSTHGENKRAWHRSIWAFLFVMLRYLSGVSGNARV